jgi:hypothetical protein
MKEPEALPEVLTLSQMIFTANRHRVFRCKFNIDLIRGLIELIYSNNLSWLITDRVSGFTPLH